MQRTEEYYDELEDLVNIVNKYNSPLWREFALKHKIVKPTTMTVTCEINRWSDLRRDADGWTKTLKAHIKFFNGRNQVVISETALVVDNVIRINRKLT